MENLLLPNSIEYRDGEKQNSGVFIIDPCYFGYGTTLGNALRRVLLSSLPGSAVTSLKIKGATHEFSVLKGVKEDVVELLLNFKTLRLKVFSDEPVKLKLHVTGEKEVLAKDIEPNSDVEVVNKDLHLATLTETKAELDIEIMVQKGRGYVSVENKGKEKNDLGVISIDSIYTPVINVGFKVEPTRVGQVTNYDKLILNIETDGSISPKEAFYQSVDILLDHFNLLKNYSLAGNNDVVEEKVDKVEENQ